MHSRNPWPAVAFLQPFCRDLRALHGIHNYKHTKPMHGCCAGVLEVMHSRNHDHAAAACSFVQPLCRDLRALVFISINTHGYCAGVLEVMIDAQSESSIAQIIAHCTTWIVLDCRSYGTSSVTKIKGLCRHIRSLFRAEIRAL